MKQLGATGRCYARRLPAVPGHPGRGATILRSWGTSNGLRGMALPSDRDGQELRTRGGTFTALVTWQEVPDLFAEKPGDRYAMPKLSSKSGAKPEFAPIL